MVDPSINEIQRPVDTRHPESIGSEGGAEAELIALFKSSMVDAAKNLGETSLRTGSNSVAPTSLVTSLIRLTGRLTMNGHDREQWPQLNTAAITHASRRPRRLTHVTVTSPARSHRVATTCQTKPRSGCRDAKGKTNPC